MKKPVKIFSDTPHLDCDYCGKNLLDENNKGNYIVFEESAADGTKLKCIKYACKEHDDIVTSEARQHKLQDAGWDDVDDLLMPVMWIKKLMAFMNEMHDPNVKMSDEYFADVKHMFLNTFPFVTREMSQQESERVAKLLQFEF